MEITSPLSVFDIRTKLAEAIDTSLPWWLANSAVAAWIGHKVFGRETADGFQIVRPDVWNSPYRRSLSITLSPSARGTVLSLVFFGYGPNNRARKELVSVVSTLVVDMSQVCHTSTRFMPS